VVRKRQGGDSREDRRGGMTTAAMGKGGRDDRVNDSPRRPSRTGCPRDTGGERGRAGLGSISMKGYPKTFANGSGSQLSHSFLFPSPFVRFFPCARRGL
jgi:hypothetical protein